MNTKIILPIFFLMILSLSVLVSAETVTYDCIDSDGGLNSAEKGIVKFGDYDYRDSCASGGEVSRVNGVEASKGDVIEYSCTAEDGSQICSSSACLYSVLKCPSGQTCDNGKCVTQDDNPFYLPQGINCEDSDGGIKYDIKGLVKYRVDDGSVNRDEDYCVTDTELREWYCDQSKKQLSVTQCEGVCACGKCFSKEEEVNCKADYNKYCNDESCFIAQKDFGDIKFISQTKLTEGCIASKDCKVYVGKYSLNSFPIMSYVELNTPINFLKLNNVLKDKFNIEPTIGDYSYSVDDGNTLFIYWISDKKIVHLEVPKRVIDKGENDDFDELSGDYLKVHPSDVQKNLNFFERIVNWFKNLFR
jgi:hypothetical protein